MKKMYTLTLLVFLCIGSTISIAQETISGMVIDEMGDPLISANVWIDRTTSGTYTLEGGRFATIRCNSAENCNGNSIESDDQSKSIIEVFPNPFVQSFNVNLKVATDDDCLFQLHGIDGKFIFEESRLLTPETDLLTFNLPNPNLPVGAYILSIRSKNKLVQSMILEKVSIE